MAKKFLGFLLMVVGILLMAVGGSCVIAFGAGGVALTPILIGFVTALVGAVLINWGINLMRSPTGESSGNRQRR